MRRIGTSIGSCMGGRRASAAGSIFQNMRINPMHSGGGAAPAAHASAQVLGRCLLRDRRAGNEQALRLQIRR